MRAEIGRALRGLLALLLLLVPAVAGAQNSTAWANAWQQSQGEERILSFISDVTIERNGDLDVTETIKLVALNQQINRGILRDFPTTYRNHLGNRTSVGFKVVSVQRNGKDEPWSRESLNNGVRLRIGNANVTLPVGTHTYAIRYRTTRQIIYGETQDELYWNATGNGWTFPIDMAEARIRLPVEAAFGNRAVYTGPQGSTASNAQVVEERPGLIIFRTTQPLGREEGLTVAAAFPKGVLAEPGAGTRAAWWFEDWAALAAGVIALIGLVGYYFRAWWLAGRGPRAGTVVPNFSPPDDLSPAAVRYVSKMAFDNRAFSAAMVGLGVKGKLHISQKKSGLFGLSTTTTLSRTDSAQAGDGQVLPAPESAMYNALFLSGETIELKQENHVRLQFARSALQKGLDEAYEGTTFRKNADWALYGLLLIALAMLAVATIGLLAASSFGLLQRIGLPLFAAALLFAALKLSGEAARTKGFFMWAATAAFGLAGGAVALSVIGMALSAGAFAIFIPLLVLPLAITAFWWMYAPTNEGRALMDRIAGFKHYLAITEEKRLDALHPPEKTPELFERYLPYAIALEVENRWADKFATVLAAAAAAGTAAHTAAWYSGNGNLWDDPAGFVGDMGDSLASTVSSASSSPSSSGGGSSGGGSSGGGGGGGGGSGW